MSFWNKVERGVRERSVAQVIGIYLVGGWAAYQVVLGLYEGLGLPRWVLPVSLLLLLVGLPVVALTALAQRARPLAENPGRSRLQRLLTWRRSLAFGVAAFALLALVTTGFVTMRSLGIGPLGTLVAKGVVDAGDRVVLADFQATGATDAALARAVTEAVRMDLMQSHLIRLVEPTQLRSALQRMQRDPAAGLAEETAREVAQREGLKAVLAGDVARLGTGNVLSLRIVGASDGAVLASFRSVARDSTELIDAVDRLSKDLRAKFGESLKNIRGGAPLWQVSTASLPALRKYSAAFEEEFKTGDEMRVVTLVEEAIALDSSFAMAHRKLGLALGNLRIRSTDAQKAIRRAHQLNDRLPELERYLTDAVFENTLGDVNKSIEAYRNALQIDSTNLVSLNNLALLLIETGDYVGAEQLLQRGVALGGGQFHWGNLVTAQFEQGKTEEAKKTYARALEKLPNNAHTLRRDVFFAAADGRYEAIDSIARAIAARFPTNITAQVNALTDRMAVARVLGQQTHYVTLTHELEKFAVRAKLQPELLGISLQRADVRALELRDPAGALREIDAALQTVPLESLAAGDRPYFSLAQVLADAEQSKRAAGVLSEAERAVPPEDRTRTWKNELAYARAYVDLRSDDAAAAIASFRNLEVIRQCRICGLAELGVAYEALHQPDSARAAYERYLTTRSLTRILTMDPRWRAFVLERLGDLHLAAGDTVRAVERYKEFVRLREHADAELQPRVRSVQARLAALRGPG
jgi:Tfp pilus assembly protein PilF